MNFELPSESKIVEGLCRLDCTIFNIEDVVNFLCENIDQKKNSDRFISWLVIFRILNQKRQTWGPDLYLMAKNYFNKCNECFSKKPNYPLIVIPKNLRAIIKSDIESGMQWFELILKGIHLKSYIDSPTLRLSRIYAMLSLEDDQFTYFPNFFHIGCICLAMTSIFSRDSRLSIDFAESIAFYLTKSVFSIIPLLHPSENNQQLLDHFHQVDELINIKSPEQSKLIKQNKSSSVYFGVRYEQLLFSCENHTINDLFNIWDQIFSHLNRIEFISCLTVSHIIQIKIPPGPQNVNEIISNWKNWDTLKIIKDALEILEHKRSFREKCCFFFCPKLDLSGYDVTNLYQ